MRKVLNLFIFLVLLSALLFVGWKAKLIPDPFGDRQNPNPPPTPLVERTELRVAVAHRPEKLLMTSLQRLLRVENHKLELVEYNPETIWLELASGEVDVVIAPIGEAVKAQGRFAAGQFLCFTGLSEGLDELVGSSKSKDWKTVAVPLKASTDFLARQMLPQAKIIPADGTEQLEAWLTGGVVDAALLDKSTQAAQHSEGYQVLATTSKEQPMPTVAVLSKIFAANASEQEFASRREVLLAALESWSGLVGYLDSESKLLKTTLKKEADDSGVDLEALLLNYQFLSPSRGRALLLEFHQQNKLKGTLDLLVLSGVENLSSPVWASTLDIPTVLASSFATEVAAEELPVPTPSPPTPSADSSPVPIASASPQEAVPTSTPAAPEGASSASVATFHLDREQLPNQWPKPLIERNLAKSLSFAPTFSGKQAMAAGRDSLELWDWTGKVLKVPLDSEPSCPPVSDGRNFFYAIENKIAAVNSKAKEVWFLEVKGTPLISPSELKEYLLVAVKENDRGRIMCIDPIDGELLWQQVLPSPPASAPVLGAETQPVVLVIDKLGEMRAWSVDKGAPLWTTKLKSPTLIQPTTGGGGVAICTPTGSVRMHSLNDGQQIWETELGTILIAAPTMTKDGVLVPAKDTYLYHLTHRNGGIGWKTALAGVLPEPAAVTKNGQIVVTSEAGEVKLLSPKGQLVDTLSLGGNWLSRVSARGDQWGLVDSAGKYRIYSSTED